MSIRDNARPVHRTSASTSDVTDGSAKAKQRKHWKRSSHRRSYYAIIATEHEIILPPFKPIGYLAQSKLFRAAQAGDVEAKQQIWLQHARLAYSAANKVRLRRDCVADAMQEAQLGIERAIRKFDVERLNEFSTYAFHWVRQAVQRQRPRILFWTRIPDNLYSAYLQFRQDIIHASSRYEWFDSRERWLDKLPKQYLRLMRLHAVACPLELTHDCCLAPTDMEPICFLIDNEQRLTVLQAISQLPERQQHIIRCRFGIEDRHKQTLNEIAQELRITRERVRQIESQAMRTLRILIIASGVGAEWIRKENEEQTEDASANESGFDHSPATSP